MTSQSGCLGGRGCVCTGAGAGGPSAFFAGLSSGACAAAADAGCVEGEGLCSCIGGFRLPTEGFWSPFVVVEGPADRTEGSLGGALAMVGAPEAADIGLPWGDWANVREGGRTGGKLDAAEDRDSTPADKGVCRTTD